VGASNKGEVEKISHFLALSANISKTVAEIRLKSLLMTNTKSQSLGVSTDTKIDALDDLELL